MKHFQHLETKLFCAADTKITFEKDEIGKAAGLIFQQIGRTMKAKKAK